MSPPAVRALTRCLCLLCVSVCYVLEGVLSISTKNLSVVKVLSSDAALRGNSANTADSVVGPPTVRPY